MSHDHTKWNKAIVKLYNTFYVNLHDTDNAKETPLLIVISLSLPSVDFLDSLSILNSSMPYTIFQLKWQMLDEYGTKFGTYTRNSKCCKQGGLVRAFKIETL